MTAAPTKPTRSPKPRAAKMLTLTQAAARLLKELEDDLRASIDEQPDLQQSLRDAYGDANAKRRTGRSHSEWQADLVTQVGASWILSAVFVRFAEDTGLIAMRTIT
jgi:hypothetical protein